ncbi:MAG: cytochrome c3 family protein [Bacteroidia bacterium]|nr:cytochrome c3 family protein [Bacteroidia bacterium]MDG2042216.1 cytochrome c3 family protein [Bacteroidia bacterium]|tara:strand:+ start:4633 stop:5562 length:930 start_codon:yes stop_codon:yes gene_type:complete
MNVPKTQIVLTTLFVLSSTFSYSNNNMSSFYSESTFFALIILSIVLIAISVLLYGIKRHLTVLNNEKNKQVAEPSLYERKFRPIIEAWNPTVATLVIAGAVMLFLGAFGYKFGMEEVGVQQGYAPTQPINFSHKIHAGQYEMDCKYCHSTVEKSKSASIPSLNTCMNCHKYVKAAEKYNGKTSPEIQKIYNAIGYDGDNMEYIEGYQQKPIEWVRIHNLPDLSYFNHSQHVVVGKVECQTCHGPIEEMEKVYQFSTLQMGWCIDCHRERGIDSENNDYYEEAHKNMLTEGKDYITVAENGGLECSKCHY